MLAAMLAAGQNNATERLTWAVAPPIAFALLARLLAMPWLDWCAVAWLIADVAQLRSLPQFAWIWTAMQADAGMAESGEAAPDPFHRASRRVARLKRALPWLLLLGLAIGLLWPLLLGQMPASRDHAIHLTQTRVFVDELVPTGRTWGYSERILPGWFAGESYPWLPYLLTGAAYLVSGGAVSLETSYAWGLAAMWLGGAASVAWLTRTIARDDAWWRVPSPHQGPLSTSSQGAGSTSRADWAACVAAALWLLDPGASREGGWEYLMFHGVWPQQLCVVLWVASLASLWSLLRAPSVRWIASTALLTALALLAHPFAMPLVLLGVLVSLSAFVLLRPQESADQTRWLALAAMAVLAALIAGACLSRFLAAAPRMGRTPVLWRPLASLARDIVLGEGVGSRRAWLFPLAIVGGLALARRQVATGVAIVALVLATLLIASEEAISVLQLDLLLGGLHNMQFPRFAIALTPLLAALAGVGATCLRPLSAERSAATTSSTRAHASDHTARGEPPVEPTREWQPAAVRFLLAFLVLAPLMTWTASGVFVRAPVAARVDLKGSSHHDQARSLAATLLELRVESRTHPGDAPEEDTHGNDVEPAEGAPVRIAVLREGSRGATWPMLVLASVGIDGIMLEGHVPTLNVEHRILSHDPAVLAELGVTHVLYFGRIKAGDPLRDAIGTPKRFGSLRLAALERLPQRKSLAVDRRGASLHFTVPKRSSTTSVEFLAVTPHPRLQVVGPNGPVEWHAASIHRGLVGIRLVGIEPGTYEVRLRVGSRERALEILALVVGIATLALLLVGVPLAPRPITLMTRWWYRPLALVLALALLGGAYVRIRSRLADAWLTAAGLHTSPREGKRGEADVVVSRDTFRGELRLDVTARKGSTLMRACDGMDARDARAGCDPSDEQLRTSVHFTSKSFFRCLQIPVPPKSSLTVRWFRREPSDDVLVLLTATEDGTGGLEYALGEETPVPLPRERRVWSRGDTVSSPVDALTLVNRSSAMRRVCASAAELAHVEIGAPQMQSADPQ